MTATDLTPATPGDGVHREPAAPAHGRAARAAVAGVVLWTAAMLAVTLRWHPTPLYTVETDLIGEYLPAARELGLGTITAAHYTFKGPGYPALLAVFTAACAGDGFLAARLLSVLAAALVAWLTFVLVERRSGARVAGVALAATLLAPAFVRYAIEAGTDMPALALMLAATLLVLEARGMRAVACAGLIAGCAMLTRGNAAFLVPAALGVLAFRSDRARRLAAYGAGCALPLAVWWVACMRSGVTIHDRNYLNIAYELYGRDLPWGEFETAIGSRFRSLAHVVAYDPLHAALRIATNLVAHRVRDLRELMPVWLGLVALPGFFLLARERVWRAPLLHAAGCALVLATVFYNARFALYLLPFCAAAAALALVRAAQWTVARGPRLAIPARALVAGLLVASGVVAGAGIAEPLRNAPHEVRRAAAALARLGAAGERIVARKPHVAHFARMTHVPMPETATVFDLLHRARTAGADWLFLSAVERATRPEFAVLADSGVKLPGLEPVEWDGTRGHYYALYRLGAAPLDSAAFVTPLAAATTRYAERHRDDPDALLFVALQWVALSRYDEALACLDDLRRRGVVDARTEQLRSDAFLGLARLDSAAAAIGRSLALAPPIASRWARLGEIRARERRFAEARHCYARAVAIEPASVKWLERLGLAHLELGEPRAAAAAFDRCVQLAPRDVQLRRYAMGAWQLAGDEARVRARFDEGVRLGLASAELLGTDATPAAIGGR